MHFLIHLVVAVLLMLSYQLNAQLNVPVVGGGRSMAMGGAGLSFTDANAIWSNVAGIAEVDALSVGLLGEQRFAIDDVRLMSASAVVPIGKSAGVGLMLGYYGFSAYNENRIGVSYGRKLSTKINIGAQVYTLGTRIPTYGNKQVVGFELGMQGTISRQLSLAARVSNPVRVPLLEDEDLPALLGVGIQYQPRKQVLILVEAEKDLLLPVSVKVGIEYQVKSSLYLRTGIATSPSIFSFGLGYGLLQDWQLDFAVSYHQYLGVTPGISLIYSRRK